MDSDEAGRVIYKITIPPQFGLIPQVMSHEIPNLRGGAPQVRKSLEFRKATPLEYLERWAAANEVFGDDVRLTSVIQWADGQVSFAIRQPQYHGRQASDREIEAYFIAASWTMIPDPDGEHALFYNYAFQTLAIDALPRNCYIGEAGLLPFDVILCRPDGELENYLELWPS